MNNGKKSNFKEVYLTGNTTATRKPLGNVVGDQQVANKKALSNTEQEVKTSYKVNNHPYAVGTSTFKYGGDKGVATKSAVTKANTNHQKWGGRGRTGESL